MLRSEGWSRSPASPAAASRLFANSCNVAKTTTAGTGGRYEKEMGALRDQFVSSRGGAPPEEELRAHLAHLSHQKMADLGRCPTSDGMGDRRDWLPTRGVLAPPPDVVAHCVNEKTEAQRWKSDVFGNFAGGRGVSLGAKLHGPMPKSNKRITAPPNGGPLLSIRGFPNASLINLPRRLGSRPPLAYVGLVRELRLGPAANLPGQSRIFE